MIKSELVQRMAARNPHLYQRDVENIVDAILDEITAGLARGERVELRGFGAFSTKQRSARTGRNPRTGDQVPVIEKLVPFFKTGKEMRERRRAIVIVGLSFVAVRAMGLSALDDGECARKGRNEDAPQTGCHLANCNSAAGVRLRQSA